MEVTIEQKVLAEALTDAKRAVNRFSSLVVLGNVLVTAKDSVLELTSTNLETMITRTVSASVARPGSTTVPAGTFSDLVNAMPGGVVTMGLNEKTQTLGLICGKNSANIKGKEASEFPQVGDGKVRLARTFSAAEIRKALAIAALAASKDESRPMLTGVLAQFESDILILAAADGFRLSVVRLKLSQPVPEPMTVLIPSNSIKEFLKLKLDAEEIELVIEERRAVFRGEGVVVRSQLLDLPYPDYGQIIPNKHAVRAVIERKQLARACKAATVFARESANNVRFSFQNGLPMGSVQLTARSDETGDNTTVVDAAIEGEDIQISFNVGYVADILSALSEDQIVVEMTTPSSPGVIKPFGNDDVIYVVMPMQVGG